MTNQSRGRHSRPPSEFRSKAGRVLETVMDEANRRWLKLAGGVAGVTVFAVVGLAVLPDGGPSSQAEPAAAAKGAKPTKFITGSPETAPMEAADPDEVPEAVAFLRIKDPEARYVKHVTEVRRSGTFLRVYTDLKESDDNSGAAIAICEWTVEFLREQEGDGEPIVFVHAKENDNGNVVVANKQSAGDDCKVGG